MNEKIAAAGNQVKQAFGKVRDGWRELEPVKKRIILIAGAGLIVLALGLVIALNVSAGRSVVLYPEMSREESVEALGVLQTAGTTGASINDSGQLEVPANKTNEAMGQLAIQGLPRSTLQYDILGEAGGLTTTDAEKQAYQVNQLQNRLQDIIKTYDGVDNAFVTLNIVRNSNRVWDTDFGDNSAGVKISMLPNESLTAGQVAGIRYLVGSSVGIDPANVSVMNSSGEVLAAAGDLNDTSYASTQDFLQRQGFEEEVEKRLVDKANRMLSLPYPSPEDYVVAATVELDWDAMITESMEYKPWEDSDHGVANHDEYRSQMGTGQYAQGVVGETNNTDVPTYADLDGDGELDAVDYFQSRDYLVSYVKQQVEKDGAKIADATISIMVRGTLNNEMRQSLRELIAGATNLPMEDVVVQGMLEGSTNEPEPSPGAQTIFGIPVLFFYIALGVLVVAIIALVIILVLRNRAKKKRLAEEAAALAAEQEEAERVQREIEERKLQLKNAAMGDQSENAIADEVRDFAKQNPEITANLLRNWLKEGEA